MARTEQLLDIYIDANILMLIAFCLWSIARLIMARMGYRTAFAVQLTLLKGVLAGLLLSPVAIVMLSLLVSLGVVAANHGMTFTDYVVAQYLNGSIEMSALKFEQMMGLRDSVTSSVLSPSGWLGQGILILALTGAGVSLIRLGGSAFYLWRAVSGSFHLKRYGPLEIRVSERIVVPFSTRGLRRRYIVLPYAMLTSPNDLRMVTAHEIQHIRQRDIEWEFGLELIKPLFFWNPAFILVKRQIERLRELACDQRVLSRDMFDARAYGDCLLRVCEASLQRRQEARLSVAFAGLVPRYWQSDKASFLRQRMTLLFEPSRVNARLVPVILAPIAGVMALTVIALQSPGDWSHDRLMLSTIINLERLEAHNTLARRP